MNFLHVALRRRRRNRRGGFTLVEVVMAMVVFVMLAAAVFSILGAVLKASATLQDNQGRQEKLEALQAFLHHQWRSLFAGDTIVSYQRGDGEGLKINGLLWGNASLATVLDAKIQPNGYYELRLVHISKVNLDPNNAAAQSNPIPFLVALVQSDDATLDWIPLIHDVRQISWRFQGPSANSWTDNWNTSGSTSNPSAGSSNNPCVVELTLQLAGDLRPAVMDFWIPSLLPAPASSPLLQ